MDKTITLIMAASVLLMAGLTVAILGAGSVGDIDQSADDVSTTQSCQYQAEQLDEGNIDADDVDDKCNFNPSVQNSVLSQDESISNALLP